MREGTTGRDIEGLIFDVDTFAVHDGPGIRMSVYFKGCPLVCEWCHSPESQSAKPQLILARDRCVACGTCVQVCPQGVHHFDDGRHVVERDRCIVCGQCAQACVPGALAIKGYTITAGEIIDQARRLKPFFDSSGGGITLTGGEVTLQTSFAEAILHGCQAMGIHTAIETCGASSWDRLEKLVRHTDLVLYDLKLIDEEAHRRWTGGSNRRILDNAARLVGRNVQVRVPLIPHITDTEENLRGILAFVGRVGLSSVALLPYNASAGAKYEWLGRPYELEGEQQTDEQLGTFLAMACEEGLDAVVD